MSKITLLWIDIDGAAAIKEQFTTMCYRVDGRLLHIVRQSRFNG